MAVTKDTELTPEEIQVRLKPVLGVRPGIYLTAIYAVALAGALFLLLFYPGIRNHGSVVEFRSVPRGSAVYIDGAWAGATPLRVYVDSGAHDIMIVSRGFRPDRYELEVRGRLFASLFLPRRAESARTLELIDAAELFAPAFTDFSEWALVTPFTSTYRPVPVVSDAVESFLASGIADSEGLMESFLQSSLVNASSPQVAADILRALALAYSREGTTTPTALLHVVRYFIHLAGEYENSLFLLADLSGASGATGIIEEPWFGSLVRAYRESLESPKNDRPAGDVSSARRVVIEGIGFVRVPAGRYLRGMSANGAEHPHLRHVDELLVMPGEVTQSEYAAFIASDPSWAPANRAALVRAGLVTDEYLSDWDPVVRADEPVRFVSWYAADAYTRYLDSRLPDRYEARLPTETEWEWIARYTDERTDAAFPTGRSGPVPLSVFQRAAAVPANLLGNLWEWCDSWYYPESYYLTSFDGTALEDTIDLFAGAERVLRGGSFADEPIDRIDAATRGSNPPSWCSPVTGFRVVVVEPE